MPLSWIDILAAPMASCTKRSVRRTSFAIFEKGFRIEIADFAGDLAIVIRGVEGLNPPNAAFAFFKIGPKRFEIVADWA